MNGYENENKKDGGGDSEEATQWRVASFGSWIAMTDWDDDGDLDALIGSFAGKLFLRENIGTRDKPIFSGDSNQVNVDGEPLKVTGHASPVVADWDGDGIWDLIVGSSDGSVGWYKNTGSKGSPEFGGRQELVSKKSENKFMVQNLADGEEPKPAVRAQICVTDYNLDGKLDLIVGDYSDINWTKELTEKEQKAFDENAARRKELGDRITIVREKMYPDAKADKPDEEAMASLEKEYEEIIDEYMKLDEQIKDFYAESRSASFIWMYERKK